MNLHSLSSHSHYPKPIFYPEKYTDDANKGEINTSCASEVHGSIKDVKISKTRNTYMLGSSCRFQLEQDVLRLQKLLNEEIELHAILENAIEQATITSSDLSSLPDNAKKLLSNIATLEMTVSRLEQEAISLQFQLIQERNERRIAEFHLKQLPSSQMFIDSPENSQMMNIKRAIGVQHKIVSSEQSQPDIFSIRKHIPVKGLYTQPNLLSEEMVRCMKNIFISLADSSLHPSKSFSSESFCSSSSPRGHFSSSSFWSLSEPSTLFSWANSPQVVLQCETELIAKGNAFDPYKAHGKFSWTDIGNYGLAIEVSWMSVGKKQLEYAAGALRRFRSLVEELAKVNPIHLNHNEKLAFWINLYNALVMHAYLAYGVPKSDVKLFSLLQKAAYTVGGCSFSAACIEHVILKMKALAYKPQTALLLALQKLKLTAEQRKCSIEAPEPLAVFALSCGLNSSPAVRIYTANNVREELQEAQRDFIRASVGLSSKAKLLIPKMLHCFARGFVDEANLTTWIFRFLPQQQVNLIEQCISQRRNGFLGSRNCVVLPYDSRFRYLFLPDILPERIFRES
ncbi:putative ternary complex factor MIP1, leucine-zipper [Dioscorea sansibarensis]